MGGIFFLFETCLKIALTQNSLLHDKKNKIEIEPENPLEQSSANMFLSGYNFPSL